MSKENSKLGPTGEFPDGKIHPDDEGELKIEIGIDVEKNIVVMHFGRPMAWIGMIPEQAMEIADDLINKANMLEGPNGT